MSPLDSSIPLSVRPPQIDSPTDVLVKALSIGHLRNQQVTDQQQQQLNAQTIAGGKIKLTDAQRAETARQNFLDIIGKTPMVNEDGVSVYDIASIYRAA
jgi:hypothetical protein